MRKVVLLFVCAFLWCSGCREARQPAGSSHAADIQALRDVEVAEEQSWISKDLDKAVSFIADDAVVMNPNTAALRGKDQIRASMKQGFDDPNSVLAYQITAVEVAQSGELGYTSGTYTFTSSDPITKNPVTDHGNWLTVRKKQPDGSWKIVRDMSNSDLPLRNPGK
jgi:uncharacterized protein (TIGR02246 family)